MKINKMITAIILLLLLAGSLASIQPASSALRKGNIFVSENPDPCGVGQDIMLYGWITPLPVYTPPDAVYWNNVNVEVTAPDGKRTNYGPLTCDLAAIFYVFFKPDQIGTYSVKASWDGNSTRASQAYIYEPASVTSQFVVQKDPILPWPSAPLPGEDDYWERPISAEYREWNTVAGSWLVAGGPSRGGYDASGSNYQPYSRAPSTAHVNWALDATQGGLVGGVSGSAKFTDQADMIILGGIGVYADSWTTIPHSAGTGYYNPANATELVTFTLHGVNVRTGEELWTQPAYSYGIAIGAGGGRTGPMLVGCIEPVPFAMSSGGSGPKSYLLSIGTTFGRWDAKTGTQMMLMNKSLTGTFDGRYVYTRSGSRLIKWDAVELGKGETIASVAVYNVTAPSVSYGGTVSYLSPSMIEGDYGIATYSVAYDENTKTAPGIAGLDLKTGTLMWNKTLYGYEGSQYTSCLSSGKYFVQSGDTKWHCFDIKTGAELWTSEAEVLPWALFGGYASAQAYGLFFAERYDGYLYAYDINTGKIVWKYFSGNSGTETPYGTWPWFSPPAVADGKLYASLSEHSPSNPPFRGGKLYCFNATTGEVLWKLPWLGGYKAIADGMLVAQNEYDGRLYGFGKGPSATTLSASPKVADQGSKVLVEGIITDESPGTKSSALTARFPNGVPAVADANMSEWMEYLYMQKYPAPENIKGVEVTVTVLDPNGNTYVVGKTNTDTDGFYRMSFEPPVPGDYTVTTEFKGSQSYYSSSAKTAISISEAQTTQKPSAIPTPTATQPPIQPTYSLPASSTATSAQPPTSFGPVATYTTIAAVVVVIVAVTAALILRRRKK